MCVCVLCRPEPWVLNVCVDLQTSARRCNLICRKERVVSHDWFKGPQAQGCASVPGWCVCVCVCVCVEACMCARMPTRICLQVFVFHRVRCRNVSVCYCRLLNGRTVEIKKVLKFAMRVNKTRMLHLFCCFWFWTRVQMKVRPLLINRLHMWKKVQLCLRLRCRVCLQLSVYTSLIIRALF